jgi:hypothetical protein
VTDQLKTDNPPENAPADRNLTVARQSSLVEEYRVGNKRPPLQTRFRPGQSGNPKGRPPKSRNLKNELFDELSERIPVREGGRRRMISKQRGLVKALINRGLSSDVRAIMAVFSLQARLLADIPELGTEQALSPSDVAIVEEFLHSRLIVSKASSSDRR